MSGFAKFFFLSAFMITTFTIANDCQPVTECHDECVSYTSPGVCFQNGPVCSTHYCPAECHEETYCVSYYGPGLCFQEGTKTVCN